jgi:hypothetical protein
MKLCVLYNRSGKILAAVQLNQPLLLDKYMSAPRPVPQKGQRVADMEVPEEFRHLSFLDACTRLKIDIKAKRPVLVLAQKRRAR